MENINTETFVSSLMYIGFDKVDSFLYTETLGSVLWDYNGSSMFTFNDEPLSPKFQEYVSVNGVSFQLRKGYILDNDLKKDLTINEKLIDIFNEIDFGRIIHKKAEMAKATSLSELDNDCFCKKEKEILKELGFGANKKRAK